MAHLIVVSYDIPSDRRRLRLAHALKDFGVRVQYSVFECHLEPEDLERLRQQLGKLVDPVEDSVRLYGGIATLGITEPARVLFQRTWSFPD